MTPVVRSAVEAVASQGILLLRTSTATNAGVCAYSPLSQPERVIVSVGLPHAGCPHVAELDVTVRDGVASWIWPYWYRVGGARDMAVALLRQAAPRAGRR